MSKDIIYFAENVCGLKLPKWQKEMLLQLYETYKKGGHFVINVCRHQGKQLLQNILINYELWSKDQRIAELEEQLKSAIRFKTPQIERFAVVQYVHRKGKPYKIEHCYDTYKDENMNTVYCYYDCDSYNFQVIQICDTKEEAQAKLEELKGENNVKD